jgi:hypothetical protein
VRQRATRQQLLVRLHRLLHLRLLRALKPAESRMVLIENEAKTGESFSLPAEAPAPRA